VMGRGRGNGTSEDHAATGGLAEDARYAAHCLRAPAKALAEPVAHFNSATRPKITHGVPRECSRVACDVSQTGSPVFSAAGGIRPVL